MPSRNLLVMQNREVRMQLYLICEFHLSSYSVGCCETVVDCENGSVSFGTCGAKNFRSTIQNVNSCICGRQSTHWWVGGSHPAKSVSSDVEIVILTFWQLTELSWLFVLTKCLWLFGFAKWKVAFQNRFLKPWVQKSLKELPEEESREFAEVYQVDCTLLLQSHSHCFVLFGKHKYKQRRNDPWRDKYDFAVQ